MATTIKIDKPAKQWNAMRALSKSSLLRNDSMPYQILAKTCIKCFAEKPAKEFSKRSASKDGLQSNCKACSSAISFAWSAENKAHLAATAKTYRNANKERLSDKSFAWRKCKLLDGKLNAERLRELLVYCEKTGVFTYRASRGRYKEGDVAGTKGRFGYWSNNIDGTVYAAHRLAWLYVHGEWPMQEIDHIDGDPSNNKIQNLRDVSSLVNKQNIRRAPSNKKYSPLLGAHWSTQTRKWKSSIKVNGVLVRLGTFATDMDAHAAYIAAKRKMHDGCTI